MGRKANRKERGEAETVGVVRNKPERKEGKEGWKIGVDWRKAIIILWLYRYSIMQISGTAEISQSN